MENVLLNYLKENISENVSIAPWADQKKLPFILTEKYNFYQVELLGVSCVFIKILIDTPGIIEMQKHMNLIGKHTKSHLAFLFKSISHYKRKNMIEHRLPFIVENGQMYLPFLGLDLNQETKEQMISIDQFTPTSQFVFLYFLYHQDLVINATELANRMNFSQMHVVRALKNLYNLGLLTYEIGGKTGRSKYYRRIQDPDYYRIGKDYLRNPVGQVVYVEEVNEDYLVAGLDALSKMSMLNPPKQSIRAISKAKAKKIKNNFIKSIDRIADGNLVEIQIWDYDPEFLTKNGQIDVLSLSLSLSDLNDERVDQAMDERLEGESWYMG